MRSPTLGCACLFIFALSLLTPASTCVAQNLNPSPQYVCVGQGLWGCALEDPQTSWMWSYAYNLTAIGYAPVGQPIRFIIHPYIYPTGLAPDPLEDLDNWIDPEPTQDTLVSEWRFTKYGGTPENPVQSESLWAETTRTFTANDAGAWQIQWWCRDKAYINGQYEEDIDDCPCYDQQCWDASGTFYVTVDASGPTTPQVNDGLAADEGLTTSTTTLSANWTQSTDSESGIMRYDYAIGTTGGGTDVVNWTSAGTSTSVTRADLSLVPGQTYYFSVRALNNANMQSSVGTSDGITVTPVVYNEDDSMASLAVLPDGSAVQLYGKVVTAGSGVMSSSMYVQDRLGLVQVPGHFSKAAIRVLSSAASIPEGDSVAVTGALTTNPVTSERAIQASAVTALAHNQYLPQEMVSAATDVQAAARRRVIAKGTVASETAGSYLLQNGVALSKTGYAPGSAPVLQVGDTVYCAGVSVPGPAIAVTALDKILDADDVPGPASGDYECGGIAIGTALINHDVPSEINPYPPCLAAGVVLIDNYTCVTWEELEPSVASHGYKAYELTDRHPIDAPYPGTYDLGSNPGHVFEPGYCFDVPGSPSRRSGKKCLALGTLVFHNGKHTLERRAEYLTRCSIEDPGSNHSSASTLSMCVDNMLITEPSEPMQILVHDGRPQIEIPVTLHDGLQNNETTISALIYRIPSGPAPDKVITLEHASNNGTATLTWNTAELDAFGQPFEPGIYALSVVAQHPELGWNVDYGVCDFTASRSPTGELAGLLDTDQSTTTRTSVEFSITSVTEQPSGQAQAHISYNLSANAPTPTVPPTEFILKVRGPDYADVPITTDPQILPTDLGTGHGVDVSFTPTLPGRYYILVCAKDGHVHMDRDHREQPTLVEGTTLCIPEVTVLEPSGTIGGKIPVRVQVKSCGACADYLIVEEHEETTAHGWEWRTIGIGTGSQGVESEEEVDGIRTRVYRFDWDTTQVHNGAHIIRARARGNPSDYYRGTTHSVNVMNLTITSVTPDDHIAWDGETPPQPITVTIEDNDLTDPVSVTLTIHDCSAESPEADTVWSEALLCVAGGSVVFEWDGSIGGSVPTAYAEPGLYTYEVVASQLDSNGPDLQVQDSTCYRSSFLHLVRSQDEFFQPIYEVEFDHYDDKGTPEEEDDFVYLVRYYSLVNDGNRNAGEGMLKLYDPDMQLVTSWNVMSLQDLAATNGLVAGTTAVEHRLLLPVSASMMDKAGTYRFVLHAVDDHAVDYRDHRFKRPAFDLNARKTEQPIIYIADGKWHIVWCRRRFQHIIVRDIELYPKPGRVRPAMEFAKAEYTPNGFVVAAINGGFFATANPHDITGEVGVGSAQWAFEGNPIPIYRGDRYCFGMRNASDYFGYSKLAPNSRKTGLMAPLPFKEMYPYGLTGVGLLVRNGQTKTAPVGWPWGLEQYTDTARTAVAWSEKGDLLLVVTDGANWRQTAEYVAALPDLIDARYSIRKDDDKIGIIKAAFMLDGSGSSQLGYCWRDAGGAVREQGSMAPADNRPIRNIIRVMALCK